MTIAELIPLVWLVIAVVGLALAIMSEIEAIQDFLVTRPTNGFRMLAVGDMLQEGIRILLYGIFAVIGMLYVLDETRTLDPDRLGTSLALVAAEVLLVIKTSIQLLVRRYLRRTTSIGGPKH